MSAVRLTLTRPADDDRDAPGCADAIARLGEVAVFAPVGLLLRTIEELPERRRLIEQQVRAARWIGEMTVRFAAAEWQRSRRSAPATPQAQPPAVAQPTTGVQDAPAPSEGYETSAAAHIVARLARLSDAELRGVRDYEAHRRNRQTIVAKVDQLLDG